MNVDNIIPNKPWEFDLEVTKVFENMLERSIPNYTDMRKLSVDVADRLLLGHLDNFTMLDLGCSNGLNLKQFVQKYGGKGKYTGVDCSSSMLEDFKNRFSMFPSGVITALNMDLKSDFPSGNYDIVTAILFLCFVPIQYRQSILKNIYNSLVDGGVFIFVEKVLGNSLSIDKALVENYYDLKRANGYTDEQIERKRLSLDGVQVPIMSQWNIEMLKSTGFSQVDVFWRYLNFEGYVCVKGY